MIQQARRHLASTALLSAGLPGACNAHVLSIFMSPMAMHTDVVAVDAAQQGHARAAIARRVSLARGHRAVRFRAPSELSVPSAGGSSRKFEAESKHMDSGSQISALSGRHHSESFGDGSLTACEMQSLAQHSRSISQLHLLTGAPQLSTSAIDDDAGARLGRKSVSQLDVLIQAQHATPSGGHPVQVGITRGLSREAAALGSASASLHWVEPEMGKPSAQMLQLQHPDDRLTQSNAQQQAGMSLRLSPGSSDFAAAVAEISPIKFNQATLTERHTVQNRLDQTLHIFTNPIGGECYNKADRQCQGNGW
jgi:hypothetical protein